MRTPSLLDADAETAYLANAIVLVALSRGQSITAQEASDAAVATCSLGLENWPLHWLPASVTPCAPEDSPATISSPSSR